MSNTVFRATSGVIAVGLIAWFVSFMLPGRTPGNFGWGDVTMFTLFVLAVTWVIWTPGTRKWIFRFFRRKPLGAIGGIVVVFLILAAIMATLAKPFGENTINAPDVFMSPQFKHFFGTDELGRDIFSRVLVGSRVSLFVGISAVTISAFFGLLFGVLSGFFSGWIDNLIQRVMDTLMAFPSLILALVIIAVFGQSLVLVIVAISVTAIPRTSRVVRGCVLSIKQEQYIEAAKSIGVTNARLLIRHVVPNVMAPMIVIITMGLGGAILVEGSLSFLGLGPPPPDPTWGRMLSGASAQYMEKAPWMAVFPGLAISVVVLAFNFLGDALRDVLDPRMRGSR